MKNKPDCPVNWDELPDLAEYVAVDEDGAMFWYDSRPRKTNNLWSTSGKARLIGLIKLDVETDWKTLIWKRPTSTDTSAQ